MILGLRGRDGVLAVVEAALALDGCVVRAPGRSGLTVFVDLVVKRSDRPVLRIRCGAPVVEALYEALCRAGDVPSAVALAGAPDRRGIGDALRRWCRGSVRPVVVVEDAHRGLPGDEVLLGVVVSAAAAGGAAVLVATRPGPLPGPVRALRSIGLPLLSPADVEPVARVALDAVPDAPVLAEVAWLCGGRAAVARDAARALLASGAVVVVDGVAYLAGPGHAWAAAAADPGLRSLLDPLDARERDLLTRLARGADLVELTAMSGSLDRAQEAGLIDLRDGEVTWPVPLVARVLGAPASPAGVAGNEPVSVLLTGLVRVNAVRDPAQAAVVLESEGSRAALVAAGRLRAVPGDLGWNDVSRACRHVRGNDRPVGARTGLQGAAFVLGVEAGAALRAAGGPAARAVLAAGLAVPGPGNMPAVLARAGVGLCTGEHRAALRLLRARGAALPGADELAAVVDARDAATLFAAPAAGEVAALVHAGRWDDALLAAGRAQACAAEHPLRVMHADRAWAAVVLGHRGYIDRAHRWLDQTNGVPVLAHLGHWARSGLHATVGDLAAAAEALEVARCGAAQEGTVSTAGLLLERAVALHLQAGDRAAAAATLRELRTRCSAEEDPSVRVGILLATAQVTGEARPACEALAIARDAGRPADLARAHVGVAGVDGSAPRHLWAAWRIYADLGATLSRCRAAARLRALGERADDGAVDAAGLTAVDRMLGGLIVGGHGNRAIASALVLSEKRIEARITALARRFGVRGRVALAARLGDLLPDS